MKIGNNLIEFEMTQKMEEPNVSVIILNAFSVDNLKECLESLKRTDYPNFDIIVVDCLTPEIELFIGTNFPEVKLISLDEDIGPSAMHNVGIRSCLSEYISFLDNDTVVDKKWLEKMMSCILLDENIGGAQAKILLYDKRNILNSNGNKANYLAIGWPDGYGDLDSKNVKVREISFPSGCGMVLRREALEKISMFDEDYFIYADDLDVGLRMMMAGYKIVICPRSIIYHKYKFLKNRRNFYYLNRNRIQTFLKLYKWKTYILLIPAILAYEISIIGFAILNGFLKEIIKAYAYNIKNVKKILKKRNQIKKYKVLSDSDLIKKLDGAVNFSEISNIPYVEVMLNPFLEYYKEILKNIVRW